MKPKIFKPRYAPVLWAVLLMYAGPWLVGMLHAALSRSTDDWKLFWALSGTLWMLAGLLQMREALLKRIVFAETIVVEMYLRRSAEQSYASPVHIVGDAAVFRTQRVQLRYMANAAELMQEFVTLAGMEKMDLVYEENGRKTGDWSTEKNLACLIAFALYMMAMTGLRLHPLKLIGPATDAMLLGWAVMLPVLLVWKVVRLFRERLRMEKEEKARWAQRKSYDR
jgi:hypothetical protein